MGLLLVPSKLINKAQSYSLITSSIGKNGSLFSLIRFKGGNMSDDDTNQYPPGTQTNDEGKKEEGEIDTIENQLGLK